MDNNGNCSLFNRPLLLSFKKGVTKIKMKETVKMGFQRSSSFVSPEQYFFNRIIF